MIGKLSAIGVIAIALFAMAVIGEAEADVLSLDCYDSAGHDDKIWVDSEKSAVTQSWINEPAETFHAEISATEIKWSGKGARASTPYNWVDSSIDRTSGVLTQNGEGLSSGQFTSQCTKGTTPFPATKF